jgi:thiol-disulfide isomerase/thioredoxin
MNVTFPASRRLAAFAAAAALTLLVALPSPSRADDVSLTCLGGARLSDADLARGATVVVTWATWSPRSHDIAERVSALASRWGSRARVVTVSFQEDRAVVERFIKGKSFGAPVCLDPDGAFSRKYDVATLPSLVVLKDGKVAHHGKLGDDADQILAGILP